MGIVATGVSLLPRPGAGAETGVDEALMHVLIGQEVSVLVKGIDPANHIVACSRREAVEQVLPQVMEMLNAKAGEVIPVTVRGVVYRERHPSLVVDVRGDVLAEIPRSKAAIQYVRPLREQYRPGQEINVKILESDPISLSVRGARPDPWARANFRRRSVISGTVYAVQDGKVFVEPDLCLGILGLAPVPLMGGVTRGMRVRCRVRKFDPENRKLHLYLVSQI